MTDIRWIQRLRHFSKALSQLTRFMQKGELNELEEQGLIQAFEYTHELAWKTLKDFLESRGVANLYGSKDVSREAFKQGLIEDGEAWMDMIRSRNLTSHTYNEDVASAIVAQIRNTYFSEFQRLQSVLQPLAEREK